MKFTARFCLALSVIFVSACSTFQAKEPAPPVDQPKPIAVPVGKNWQVVEEPPKLTNERTNRLPFQTEESLQPEGTGTAPPATDRRKIIETPR